MGSQQDTADAIATARAALARGEEVRIYQYGSDVTPSLVAAHGSIEAYLDWTEAMSSAVSDLFARWSAMLDDAVGVTPR